MLRYVTDHHAGDAEHLHAAKALFEHGRGIARAALVRVANDVNAPSSARVHAVTRLAEMHGRARFETIWPKVVAELEFVLASIFERPSPPEVVNAAIAAVSRVRLEKMGASLVELLRHDAWDVQAAAWQALGELRLQHLLPQRAYIGELLSRLEEVEAKLFSETVTTRMIQFNNDRVEILSRCATIEHLGTILKRRFAFQIADRVKPLVDQLSKAPGNGTLAASRALGVLREPETITRWLTLLTSSTDQLEALAAAHRLEASSERLSTSQIETLIEANLQPDRLCAVAAIMISTGRASTAVTADNRVRAMIHVVHGPAEVEAVTCLTTAVMAIDDRRGVRLAAVANSILWTRRIQAAQPGIYPWTTIYDRLIVEREGADYESLLEAGGDDARAAVHMLFAAGAVRILVATNVSPTTISARNRKRLRELAEAETDEGWQRFYAGAAAQIRATDLLPWLLRIADRPVLIEIRGSGPEERFGEFTETDVGFVLRAIGYLARVARDEKLADLSASAVAYLRHRNDRLHARSDAGERAGCATGLGFVGQWEPLLSSLRRGERWLHVAAKNVVRLQISQDVANLVLVGTWIARRLEVPGLGPDVRSTLLEIKTELERRCGRLFPSQRPGKAE